MYRDAHELQERRLHLVGDVDRVREVEVATMVLQKVEQRALDELEVAGAQAAHV